MEKNIKFSQNGKKYKVPRMEKKYKVFPEWKKKYKVFLELGNTYVIKGKL